MPRLHAAIGAALIALSLQACAADVFGPSLVIVRNESRDPEGAQRAANSRCAARGAGPAQYLLIQSNPRSPGGNGGTSGGPPESLYRCVPAR